MDKEIKVTVEIDNKIDFKIMLNGTDLDITHLSGCISEAVGKSLKEQATGLY